MNILRSKTIREAVYDKLKTDIMSGIYRPGERLLETVLAKELDVSRTPIRDALVRLEKEGLIKTIPHRGVFVRKLSKEDIRDFYQTRSVLEGLGAKLAAVNATPADRSRLEAMLKEMEEIFEKYKDLDNYKEIVLSNNRFHHLILEIAGNQVLTQMLGNLASVIALVRSTSWVNKNRKVEVWLEHQKIAAAILSGDAQLAQEKAEEHIYNAWKSAERNLDH
jgi:DNA-binding GntR family transcriptional regulator